jgi:hypothetical protein
MKAEYYWARLDWSWKKAESVAFCSRNEEKSLMALFAPDKIYNFGFSVLPTEHMQ